MFDLFQSIDAFPIHFAEVIKLVLEAVIFCPFKDLRGNVVAVAVNHYFLVELALFRLALHQYKANLLELLLWHCIDGFLYNTRAVLLLAQLAKVEPDELVEAADANVHDLRLALGHLSQVLENGLDHEITVLVIYEQLD